MVRHHRCLIWLELTFRSSSLLISWQYHQLSSGKIGWHRFHHFIWTYKVFLGVLGHLEGYFENWEKDSKSTEIYLRITQISWSISKISVKFFELVVIGAIGWLSGTMVGISGVTDTFLVPNSKFSIGDLMSSIADTNFQIESYQHWLLSVTECPRVSLNCSTRVTLKKNHL